MQISPQQKFIIVFIIHLFFFNNIKSQVDSLTGLLFDNQYSSTFNLSPTSPFIFEKTFVLEFNLKLNTEKYYGNILFVAGSDSFNVRMTYINFKSKDSAYIALFINNKEVNTKYYLRNDSKIINDWEKVQLVLDSENQKVKFNYKGNSEEYNVAIPKSLNIIFGGIPPYKYYMGLDACYFAIRNINIKVDGKHKNRFKLDEISGEYAYDDIGYERGIQEGCEWIRAQSIEWKEVTKFETDSEHGVTYNSKNHDLYIVNESNIITYNLEKHTVNKVEYIKPRPRTANTALFNDYSNSLLAYYKGSGEITEYDFKTKSWSDIDISKDTLQHYFLHTNFIDNRNGDIYILGGYGWYTNKNHLQKYDWNTKRWKTIKTIGDYFYPRTSALISQSINDNEVVIYGGTGNKSGRQEEGYLQLNDLYTLNLDTYKFHKLWEIKSELPGFVAFTRAGNLILNKDTRKLYTVLKSHTNSDQDSMEAKLFEISIDSAKINELSYSIPNKRYMWNVYLFYDQALNKIILTANNYKPQNSSNKNEIIVYSIDYPPLNYKLLKREQAKKESRYQNFVASFKINGWHILVVLVLFGGFGYLLYSKRKYFWKIKKLTNENLENFSNPQTQSIMPSNAIYLFGDFQVFDKHGNNITVQFSPKLKELFLLILLNQLMNGDHRKLSSDYITTILWPDFSKTEAKNVRGVTIHNLRELLTHLDTIKLEYKGKSWVFDVGEQIYVDYSHLQNITHKISSQKIEEEDIESLLKFILEGGLLKDCSYKWLDAIQHKINSNFIENYMLLINKSVFKDDFETVIKLCDKIFSIDPVDEFALEKKLRALKQLGRKLDMNSTYQKFINEYKDLYAEDYTRALEEIIS